MADTQQQQQRTHAQYPRVQRLFEEKHANVVCSVCAVSEGVLATGSDDNTARLWDVRTGACTRTLTGHSDRVRSVCMVSGGVLATGSWDYTAKLWDVHTGSCIYTLGHSDKVRSVCMVSGGVLATGSSSTVRLWDVRTGTCIRTLTGHSDWVRSVCTVSARVLASGGGRNEIKLWNVRTGACIRTLPGHRMAVYSLCMVSAGVLASGSYDGTAKLWNVHTGACIRTLDMLSCTVIVLSLCMVSPGVLAIGSSDNAVRLWDVRTGTCIRTQKGNFPWESMCMVSASVLCMTKLWRTELWVGHVRHDDEDKPSRLWDEIGNPGSAYVSQLLWPGQTRVTYSQRTFHVVHALVQRNDRQSKTRFANGYMDLPTRALNLVAQYV